MSQAQIQALLSEDASQTERLVATYYQLCDARDAVLAQVAPVQARLDQAIARTQAAQAEERELAAEIERLWGPDWFALKRRIAEIARTLGKVPPRAA